MMNEMGYVIDTVKPFDQVADQIEKITPDHGYKVLAVHNVKETLAGKGFEIEPLKIIEVCNAGFAYKALQNDINVAMFMPCKIVVRQIENGTRITFFVLYQI